MFFAKSMAKGKKDQNASINEAPHQEKGEKGPGWNIKTCREKSELHR